MFDFNKEVTLSHAIGEFFADLEARMAEKTSYGISDWYRDVAWGVRLFNGADVPLFVGKNENTWLTLADELDSRANFFDGNPALVTVWADGVDGDVTWAESADNISMFIQYSKRMFRAVALENADFSGPLPSGERGVNLGEALKMVRIFTDLFWKSHLRWSRTPSPYKVWLVVCRKELMAAYAAMGETNVGGDLGDPNNTQVPGNIPWSMPELP